MNSMPNQMLNDSRAEFEGVASRYSRVLYSVAFRRLRNVEDAEDAVQDALLSAYKHIDQFQNRSQLSSWLTRIVINVAGMKLRSRRHHEHVSLDQDAEDGGATIATHLADAGPNPEVICAQTEMEERLRSCFTHISPKLRIAFQMRELAGFSSNETANKLQITPGAVKSCVMRARAELDLQFGAFSRTVQSHEVTPQAVTHAAHTHRRRNVRGRCRRIVNPNSAPASLQYSSRIAVSHWFTEALASRHYSTNDGVRT